MKLRACWAAVLGISALLAAGCGGSSSGDSPRSSASSSTTTVFSTGSAPTTKYPMAFRESFMVACEAHAGATAAKCECALDRIENTIPLDRLITEAGAFQRGQALSGELRRAILACA
jgi:hypothetical protein